MWREVISLLGGSPYVAAKINEAKDLLEDQAKKWMREKSEGLSMQMIIFDKWLKKSSHVFDLIKSLWLNINEAGNRIQGGTSLPIHLVTFWRNVWGSEA